MISKDKPRLRSATVEAFLRGNSSSYLPTETAKIIAYSDSAPVLAAIEMAILADMTVEQLNDWFEQRVGYRPQVDCPTMTELELRDLCNEYVRASRG